MLTPPLPHDAPLRDYEAQADVLAAALRAGDEQARWHVKWQHPQYRDAAVSDVDPGALDLDDVRLVIARCHAFHRWTDLAAFATAIAADAAIARFESSADAIANGDVDALRTSLREHPELVRARSPRRHRATLLHYVAANGVEDARQKTPPNAVDVTRALLEAGGDADALADMYEARSTTLSMLVSSAHPAQAGLQVPIADVLLEHGASLEWPGSKWHSAVMVALVFGYLDTAEALVARGARVDRAAVAAGLGWRDDLIRRLPAASAHERHVALALAAQHGHAECVRALLDEGERPDRFNPVGCHAHSTPLHQAALANHVGVVHLLVERGARTDIADTIYRATPDAWAQHAGHTDLATWLRARDTAR